MSRRGTEPRWFFRDPASLARDNIFSPPHWSCSTGHTTVWPNDLPTASPQLEVQWAYSGHLVHLQWGTVHALHAIYSGHCSYTVARYSVYTVVTYSVHTVDTLYVHCIHTVSYSAHSPQKKVSTTTSTPYTFCTVKYRPLWCFCVSFLKKSCIVLQWVYSVHYNALYAHCTSSWVYKEKMKARDMSSWSSLTHSVIQLNPNQTTSLALGASIGENTV